jgi:hypothetical protein
MGAVAMAQLDTSNWYPWTGKSTSEAGLIGMADWLDAPAGKHGRPEMRDDKIVYNGKEVKFWGLNNSYSACAPEKELSERRAAWYAKYGVNFVRLHKYADGSGWAGIQSEDSFVELDPAGLDRMDYLVAQFKKHGIYVKLSPTFGVKMGPADRKYVPFMDEFGKLEEGKNRVRAGYGAVYLAHELQDMQIAQTVSVLKHKNPYTGLSYAEDPVILTVEMFNEDSVLWNLAGPTMLASPTLKTRSAKRFCDWLKARYGDAAGLEKAWGGKALNYFKDQKIVDESLDTGTIVPYGTPWLYDITQLESKTPEIRQRMLDTMLFLYELQDEFYMRFAKAMREAGYDGPMVGSNWQAGSNLSHYYNLYSDARAGIVDRHNYFGGAQRGRMNGEFSNASMMSVPGGGMLSAGMQQVSNRPFMLSEWIHVQPNDFHVEGPALLGAYGMGLNGWDVSFMFQNGDDGGFSKAQYQHAWDVTLPKVIGVFPAVARQIYREDVKESPVLATRYVHFDSLNQGILGFRDKVSQAFDVKVLNSDKVPAESLAAARCVIEFTPEHKDTPVFDLSKYMKDGAIVSATGQLTWKGGDDQRSGWFTINTPGTQAAVGFAQGQRFELDDAVIQPESPYGAFYLTALARTGTLKTDSKILITAIARGRNTGDDLGPEENLIKDKGKAPILMEPLRATITLKRPGAKRVVLLDHDGLATDKTIPIENGVVKIDGVRDKTPYYVVEY